MSRSYCQAFVLPIAEGSIISSSSGSIGLANTSNTVLIPQQWNTTVLAWFGYWLHTQIITTNILTINSLTKDTHIRICTSTFSNVSVFQFFLFVFVKKQKKCSRTLMCFPFLCFSKVLKKQKEKKQP